MAMAWNLLVPPVNRIPPKTGNGVGAKRHHSWVPRGNLGLSRGFSVGSRRRWGTWSSSLNADPDKCPNGSPSSRALACLWPALSSVLAGLEGEGRPEHSRT